MTITRRLVLTAPALTAVSTRHNKRMTRWVECAGSPVRVPAAADQTGNNKGNLTNAFTQNVLGTMPPVFEWYRAIAATDTPGQTFTPAPCSIYVDRNPVSFTFPNGGSEWDPQQPIPMRSGQELYFYWQLAAGVTPVPVLWCRFRYDADLAANRNWAAGG